MGKVAVLKLNGGLGTSMGCSGPKSLLQVRDGLTFLDFSLKQLEAINERYGVSVPLVLMNSFNTEAETKAYLAGVKTSVEVHHFNQFELPRMDAATGLPAELPREQQFYPPGHGYVYECLKQSGTLDALLARGIEWVFISNCDNLGAVLDARICHYARASGRAFVSELTPKLEADVKGGVLVEYEGAVHLLETAQVPAEHMVDFCDARQFPYFHINNLWCDLRALRALDRVQLDLIVNPKTVCGREVVQLECAAGAMVANVATAPLVVPRSRFRPVKKSGDLLLLQSDCFAVGPGHLLEQRCGALPTVVVDAPVSRLMEMFPCAPGLRGCTRFIVEGDVECRPGASVRGEFRVPRGQRVVMEAGAVYGQ